MKLLSGVIAGQIYGHLDQQKLLAEKQKGCRKDLEELMIYFILIGQELEKSSPRKRI